MRKEVLGRVTGSLCRSKEIKAEVEIEHKGKTVLGAEKN